MWKKVKSAMDFEFVLSNPKLNKIVEALSLNERKVLFYLFWEKKTINEVARMMKMYRGTIRRLRDKALAKIGKKLIAGGYKYV